MCVLHRDCERSKLDPASHAAFGWTGMARSTPCNGGSLRRELGIAAKERRNG